MTFIHDAHVASRQNDLQRISETLALVAHAVSLIDLHRVKAIGGGSGGPVTWLDRQINQIIFESLPAEDEGWLSEENQDNPERLDRHRVWIVDPIDGTRELVEGIPEWSVSIGLVEQNKAVAAGILNPCTGEMFLGSVETGLELSQIPWGNSRSVPVRPKDNCVLVSRREFHQGKWSHMEGSSIHLIPVGSIAYRLALVAAGRAAATCTVEPRNEWDVAAGVALIEASRGSVRTSNGAPLLFNKPTPRIENLLACCPDCPPDISAILQVSSLDRQSSS